MDKQASYQRKAASDANNTGGNIRTKRKLGPVLNDEIAEWNATHARTIYDRLAGATAARGGLHVVISTAQFDRSHLGFELYEYARKVKEAEIEDPHFLPVIYNIPEESSCICGECDGDKEGWRCPEQWWLANPSVDITVPKSFYHEKYKTVQNNPREEAAFRTLLCGQWVGSAEQWIASNVWHECKEDFTEESLHGCPAFIGVDSARRLDLASHVVVVMKDDLLYILPRFYMPEDGALKKEKADRVPYIRWQTEGLIQLTPGDVIDPSAIREGIIKDCNLFDVYEVRYDPYGFEESRQILEYDHDIPMVEVRQSYQSMSSPTAYFERMILANTIRHNGNSILSWNMQNITLRSDAQDHIMIDKLRSHGRIDGASATIIAMSGVQSIEASPDLDICMLL